MLRRYDATRLPAPVADAVATALGRLHRHDPVTPKTGGPAGNARLTAWTGVALLVLFGVEGVTLLALGPMIGWHIVVGVVLVPLALLKTVTTGWRIVRYYAGQPDYRVAGPPPLLLRVLGPVVVLAGLAVLGTGLALIPLGAGSLRPMLTVFGLSVTPLDLHKAAFVGWLGVVGLHVLTRLASTLTLLRPDVRRVGGGRMRLTIIGAVTAVGVAAGFFVLPYAGGWTGHHIITDDRHEHARQEVKKTLISVSSTT